MSERGLIILAIDNDYHEEVDKGHGRLEIRRHWIVEDLSTLPNVSQWKGLRSIGRVQRECTTGEKTTLETRYFSIQLNRTRRCLLMLSGVIGVWKTVCIGVWMSPSEKMKAAYELGMHRLL